MSDSNFDFLYNVGWHLLWNANHIPFTVKFLPKRDVRDLFCHKTMKLSTRDLKRAHTFTISVLKILIFFDWLAQHKLSKRLKPTWRLLHVITSKASTMFNGRSPVTHGSCILYQTITVSTKRDWSYGGLATQRCTDRQTRWKNSIVAYWNTDCLYHSDKECSRRNLIYTIRTDEYNNFQSNIFSIHWRVLNA